MRQCSDEPVRTIRKECTRIEGGEGAGTTIPFQFFRPREGYFKKISECYIALLKALGSMDKNL